MFLTSPFPPIIFAVIINWWGRLGYKKKVRPQGDAMATSRIF